MKNSILLPIVLFCIFIVGIYIIVYFKQSRDIINKNSETLIELQETDSVNKVNFIIDRTLDSIEQVEMKDTIINNQKVIIKILKKQPVKVNSQPEIVKKGIFKKKIIINKLKKTFNVFLYLVR